MGSFHRKSALAQFSNRLFRKKAALMRRLLRGGKALTRKTFLQKTLPPPHNQIYYRFWYAFSLFLRKFHSVNPFNGNFGELGRARFAEKKMEFPSQVVSKTYSILFSAKFGPISNPFWGRASSVHDERAEWPCSRNDLCSKTWDHPRMEVETLWVSTSKKNIIFGINLFLWRGLWSLMGSFHRKSLIRTILK